MAAVTVAAAKRIETKTENAQKDGMKNTAQTRDKRDQPKGMRDSHALLFRGRGRWRGRRSFQLNEMMFIKKKEKTSIANFVVTGNIVGVVIGKAISLHVIHI